MAMNRVQFQPALSIVQFIQQYGTQAKCYRALYRWRWPMGFRCPKCDSRPRSRFNRAGRVYYQCCACRHQTTLTSGTVFEGSKLPLTTWFLAMHLLTGSKTNMSALELKRHLGVCYDTAWKLKHKIMQVMTEREESRQLKGFVQIDDAYSHADVQPGIIELMNNLKHHVHDIDARIAARFSKHQANLTKLLQNVKGVGLATIAALISELPELGQLKAK